jgi:transposase-like protein
VPPRLSDQAREAITADIRAGALSRNAIARKHEVSPSLVTKLAREAGQPEAFERQRTAKAVAAAQVDAKALRAALVADLYADAQRFRARSWEPYTQIVTGPSGPELVTTKLPPLREQQAAYTALAIAIDKAMKIEAATTGDGAEQGKTMIGDLRAALGLAYEAMETQEAQDAQGVDQDGEGSAT